MPFSPTTPVVGATITGFTSPTYPLTVDTAPSVNGKQWAISSLGGTQANVDVNTVSKPFSISMFRPQVLRTLPQANPVTGVVKNVPMNTYKVITRKGAQPAAQLVPHTARITTIIEVPAGTETYEPEEIKAMISAHFGVLYGNAQQVADVVLSGVI